MRSPKPDEEGFVASFDAVEAAERAWIGRRREAVGLPDAQADYAGLAFSGGGIRSATFNLGVLQALQQAGLLRQFDYLSSVSGGGYIAGCYAWLRHAFGSSPGDPFAQPTANGEGAALDWLRANAKYLIASRGYSGWTLAAAILTATVLNLFVLVPPLLVAVYAMTLAWLPVEGTPLFALEGLRPPDDHHGYWLLLNIGALCILAFPLLALGFGLTEGVRKRAMSPSVDRWRIAMGRALSTGIALIAVGSVPLATEFAESMMQRVESESVSALIRHATYLLPIVSGAGAVWFARLRNTLGAQGIVVLGTTVFLYGLVLLAYHLVMHVQVLTSAWFPWVLGLSLLLGWFCDLNEISLFAYYRARLSHTFLAPVAADAGAKLGLAEIDPAHGAPMPLINTTLHTSSSQQHRLRTRDGDSFFFTPLYHGALSTGFRSHRHVGHSPTLATAMTISGAAVDPDTYATASRSVSLLMALFNLRLGYWTNNPRVAKRRFHWMPPWWLRIGREMFGVGLDETRADISLSDGGHFENLGIYELVRRRLRWIVVTDAGADPNATYFDLGRAIERCRVDFGAEIELSIDTAAKQTPTHRLGTIRYADGSLGRLLYLRPMLTAAMSADLDAYKRAFPQFPDQSTAQQFYGETQFEAYRNLGRQLVLEVLGATPPATIQAWIEQLDTAAAASG